MEIRKWTGEKISEPGIWSGVPHSVYHGADLCTGPSISSSGLRKIFNESAMAYWVHSPFNPNALPAPDSRAFVVGRAAHWLCLGQEDFRKHFVVRPDEYPDAKGDMKKWTRAALFCKKWEAEASDMGLEILTPAELEMIKGLAGIQPWQKGLEDSGLLNNAVVRAGALQGIVEHAIIAIDKETGVFVKSMPDVIPTASAEGADLKTCSSVDEWELIKSVDTYRYDVQAAVFAFCLEQAAGIRMTNFSLIFVDKNQPHEVAVRELKAGDLDDAEKDMRAALRTFALGMETGRWPGIHGGAKDARYLGRSDRGRERALARREQLSAEIFG